VELSEEGKKSTISFQRKMEEVVCIADFVTKASPNIKERKIYFKIAGIQLLSALS